MQDNPRPPPCRTPRSAPSARPRALQCPGLADRGRCDGDSRGVPRLSCAPAARTRAWPRLQGARGGGRHLRGLGGYVRHGGCDGQWPPNPAPRKWPGLRMSQGRRPGSLWTGTEEGRPPAGEIPAAPFQTPDVLLRRASGFGAKGGMQHVLDFLPHFILEISLSEVVPQP